MSGETTRLTVYYDGSCPLCRAEIDHYGRQQGAEGLCFTDISPEDARPGPDLARSAAMARFHVRDPQGQLVSGAAAFVLIWQSLPRWRWAARLARLPGAMWLLEGGYRLLLPVRPLLARLAARFFAGGPARR